MLVSNCTLKMPVSVVDIRHPSHSESFYRSQMKKSIRILLALIALFGMADCFVLSPAVASHKEELCVTPEGCDDCFICCFFKHPIIISIIVPLPPMDQTSVFIETASVRLLDSPSFSIFHPPLAF